MRWGGCGGNVVPLGQSVGVPDRELLSSRDFSQHTVENLQVEKKKQTFCDVSKRAVESELRKMGGRIYLSAR